MHLETAGAIATMFITECTPECERSRKMITATQAIAETCRARLLSDFSNLASGGNFLP
jgi:hypothetical protein